MWSLPSGDQLLDLNIHNGAIDFISLSPNSEEIISCAQDLKIRCFLLKERKLKFQIDNPHANAFIRSAEYCNPMGNSFASSGDDEFIKIWDSIWGTLLKVITIQGGAITKLLANMGSGQLIICTKRYY